MNRSSVSDFEIWLRVIEAKPNKVIARELDVTVQFVKSRIRRLCEREGARNRVALAVLGVRRVLKQPYYAGYQWRDPDTDLYARYL